LPICGFKIYIGGATSETFFFLDFLKSLKTNTGDIGSLRDVEEETSTKQLLRWRPFFHEKLGEQF
jgi:hypothetical protein